jgi:hypothetical protein
VERLTNDGYFSVDVYLPDGGVALEVDGPSHFINTFSGQGVSSGNAPHARTVRTELRNLLLARRHRAVVTVPWFELAELQEAGATGARRMILSMIRRRNTWR